MPSVRRAFTLIEVLVVIAIVALLLAILLPGLDHARATARMLKEQAGGHELQVAWHAYTNEQRDRVIPGYQHWSWAHNTAGSPQRWRMLGRDPNTGGELEGTPVKPWPWRFIAATSVPYETLIFDPKQLSAMRNTPTGWDIYAFSTHTTMGMNAIFVGGHYLHGAFRPDAEPGYHPRGQGLGSFYVEQIQQIIHPDRLVIFTSAADTFANSDPKTTESYYYVQPPSPAPNGMPPGGGLTAGWTPRNAAIDRTGRITPPPPPDGRGNVRARHFGKVVTSMIDGHVQMQSYDDLRDMRKWSNWAERPDWTFQPH